jgi:hypothetical protein
MIILSKLAMVSAPDLEKRSVVRTAAERIETWHDVLKAVLSTIKECSLRKSQVKISNCLYKVYDIANAV